MSSYTISGTVIKVGETQVVSERFSKRELVIEVVDSKFPQTIALECAGNKTSLLDDVHIGDEVNAQFNIKGRKWNDKKTGVDKYFTSLDVWKLEVSRKAAQQSSLANDPDWG